MNEHPEHLLAGHVDGSLSAEERTGADAHLRECDRCRDETRLAAAARTALATLPEVPAPAGIAAGAIDRARGAGASPPRWYRWAAVSAAAAAAIVVAVVVLPGIGSRNAETKAGGGGALRSSAHVEAGASSGGLPTLERLPTNYDAGTIGQLAKAATSDAAAAANPAPTFAPGLVDLSKQAFDCIQKAAGPISGEARRLILAKFDGKPAYIGIFAEGPGAGQPPDKLLVWVVAKAGCSILSFTQARV